MTVKQQSYLLRLINRVTGKSYRYLSQVEEDGIGKMCNKVQGLSTDQASQLIDEWKAKADAAGPDFARFSEDVEEVGELDGTTLKITKSKGYSGRRSRSSYVAEITWDDDIDRDFIDEDDIDWSDYDNRKRKGDIGLSYELTDGIYEVQQWGERSYIIVEDGAAGYVSQREAAESAWKESL